MTRRLAFILLAIAGGVLSAQAALAQDRPDIQSEIVFFYYDDLEAPSAFYGETLGLKKTLDIGWAKIYELAPNASVGITLASKGLHDVSQDKPAMLSIVTTEIEAWNARLKRRGVSFVKALQPAEGGEHDAPIRNFIIEDPAGYTIEFMKWRKKPGSPPTD